MAIVAAHPPNPTDPDAFSQLDDYSFLDMLDFLQLKDLVSVASMSPRNQRLITRHYLVPDMGAQNTRLRVSIAERDSYTFAYYARERWGPRYSELCMGRECVLAALQVLCPIASDLDIRLDFTRHFDEALTQRVASYVSGHCGDVPQTVRMFGANLTVAEFQFSHAKIVYVADPQRFRHFDLAKSFPCVEHLAIDMHGRYGLAQHLPALRSFQLHDWRCGNFDLRAFGEKNPQIRRADLQICGQIENIDRVNRLFPHLESLRLKLERERATSDGVASAESSAMAPRSVALVRFRNVQSFALDLANFYGLMNGAEYRLGRHSLDEDKLTSIVFDRLESFKYITNAYIHNLNVSDQVDFIGRYADISSLDVSTIHLEYDELRRLVGSLPKLTEITVTCGLSRPADVARLMAETSLETVCLYGEFAFRDGYLRQLILPAQWSLHRVDKHPNYDETLTYKRHLNR